VEFDIVVKIYKTPIVQSPKMSDLEYPSPVWVARHSKGVGTLLILLGLAVVVSGLLGDAIDTILFGAFVGGFLLVLGVWIIDAKRMVKTVRSLSGNGRSV
jgi:hypothetical protein